METTRGSRSRGERLFGIRHPLVYLGLSVLWLVLAVTSLVTPGFLDQSWGSIALKVLIVVLALAAAAISIANIVMQRRGLWFAEPAPLAQESDPRLR